MFSLYCDGLCQDGLYGIPKNLQSTRPGHIHSLAVPGGGWGFLSGPSVSSLEGVVCVWTGDRCPLLAHNNLRGRGRRGASGRRLEATYPAKITGK